ncbi:MAG: iron-sulfur cluster carrier protein ApbC [Gammaproteobacteria bacterium]
MTTLSKDAIEQALAAYIEPCLGQDLVSAKCVRAIAVEGEKASIRLELGFPIRGYESTLIEALRHAVITATGALEVAIVLDQKILSHAVQRGVTALPEVKNIIAVASGKGGVGKSTVAVNLALALQAQGAQAAILDADIYGPSQPRMLGCRGKPESPDGKSFQPLVSYHVQAISIGNLIDEETPMIWRGPMVTSALQQLLGDTRWHRVDYLVVDLPPGTGDIQLTLCQKVPVTGAVIVTTPQDIALLDARKALKMFEKVEVPVLGVIENMSTYVCSRCGHEEHIFGEGGGASMAHQYGVELLGAVPLDTRIREGVDNGRPTVAMDPRSRSAQLFHAIARRIAAKLSLKARDYSARFPKIVIEQN